MKTINLEIPYVEIPTGSECNRESYPENASLVLGKNDEEYFFAEIPIDNNTAINVYYLSPSSRVEIMKSKEKEIFEDKIKKSFDDLKEDFAGRYERYIEKLSMLCDMITANHADTNNNILKIQKEISALPKNHGVSEATLLDIVRTVNK